jgi:hypothetical protein
VSRLNITLDEHTRAELARRAQAAGEPVAQMAARFIRDGLLSTQAQKAGAPAPAAAPTPADDQDAELSGSPPPPQRPEIRRRELWDAVCALAERYPGVFSKLVADWWSDRALVEMLGALSAWRSQLDAATTIEPRAEFLFHDRLEMLERRFTKASDPTAARFAGGSPPSEWIAPRVDIS